MDISVEEVEAMTEEEMKAYMKEKMYVLEGLVDSGDNNVDISWGDTECNCDSDFYLDINEDGE
jgi:predicted metalloprotease